MGNFVSKVTDTLGLSDYEGQKDAVRDATRLQMQANNNQLENTKLQIEYLENADKTAASRMQPYANLGRRTLPAYKDILTSEGQYDYLASNPMFQAAYDQSAKQLEGSAAASGKYNSGGLRNELFKNYLSMGDQYVGSQTNRLMNAVSMGQSAAAGQASNSLTSAQGVGGVMAGQREIYGNMGNTQSAGVVARYNANQAALQGGLNTWNNIWSGNGIMGEGSIPGMGPVSQVGGAASSWGPFLQGVGGVMGGGGGAGMASMFSSDRRKKTNIVELSRDELGGIYEFDYIDQEGRYVGRMAQELQQTRPDAVMEANGQLWVTEEFKPKRVA